MRAGAHPRLLERDLLQMAAHLGGGAGAAVPSQRGDQLDMAVRDAGRSVPAGW